MKNRFVAPAAAAALLVLLMIIFTCSDPAISGALVGKAPFFARLFETIGQLPFALILAVAPLILFFAGKERTPWARLLLALPAFAASLLGAFFAAFQTAMYIHGEEGFEPMPVLFPIALAAVVVVAAATFALRKLGRERLLAARRFALIGLCLLVLDMVTVETLKNLFGRTRPREVGVDGGLSGAWYEVHGKTGRKSFPSGHSAYAFAAVAWAFLFRKGSAARRNVFWLGILFGACTALARVIIAAHWPTDVTAGAAITLAYVGILSILFREKEQLS